METKTKKRKFDTNDFKGLIRRAESIVEILLLTAIYYLTWKCFYRVDPDSFFYGVGKVLVIIEYAAILFILMLLCEGFKYGHKKLVDVMSAQVIVVLIVDILTYFQLCIFAAQMISVWPMALMLVADLLVAGACCYIYTAIYHRIYIPKNMVMIYGHEEAVDLKFKMDQRGDKYKVTEVIPYNMDRDIVKREILRHDAVIINDVPSEVRNDILKYCYRTSKRAYVAPKISDIIVRGAEEINLFDTPLLLVKGRGLTPEQRFIKRLGDIVVSGIMLIPAGLIMIGVGIAIKKEDHGPIFYKQARVTRDGKVFNILKFRSMIVDAEKNGMSIPATGKDPRITKVGNVIRPTRIDELPQLINILKGDMSIVGPRPERTEHVKAYTEKVPEFELRNKVRGGLTGYAQIYGRYNTSAYDKLRLDLMYIENYSLFLDIKLIFMTLQIIFKKESTEGFEKQEELKVMRDKLLEECREKYDTDINC